MIRKNGGEFPQNKESVIESVRGFVVQNNLGSLCYTLGWIVIVLELNSTWFSKW